MPFRVAAIICVRNESLHIRRCLSQLIEDEIEVYLIDHASTDDSRGIAEEFLGRGLVSIYDLPWKGHFSMTDQLAFKSGILNDLTHDWVMNIDADEWLQAPSAGASLRESLRDVDRQGADYVNFHEIVFLPVREQLCSSANYTKRMLHYYFLQPSYPRLARAWKRDINTTPFYSGGHWFREPDLKKHSEDFLLRHYIACSSEHARRKYLNRQFAQEDLDKNWHLNRINLEPEQFDVKNHIAVRKLPCSDSRDFDLSRPVRDHYWNWPGPSNAPA